MIIFLYSLSRFLLLLQSMFVCLGLWPMCPKNVCRIAVYVAFLQIYELFFEFPQINFTPEQSVQSIKKLFRFYYISSADFVWKFHCKKSINCLKQTRDGEKWRGGGTRPGSVGGLIPAIWRVVCSRAISSNQRVHWSGRCQVASRRGWGRGKGSVHWRTAQHSTGHSC